MMTGSFIWYTEFMSTEFRCKIQLKVKEILSFHWHLFASFSISLVKISIRILLVFMSWWCVHFDETSKYAIMWKYLGIIKKDWLKINSGKIEKTNRRVRFVRWKRRRHRMIGELRWKCVSWRWWFFYSFEAAGYILIMFGSQCTSIHAHGTTSRNIWW